MAIRKVGKTRRNRRVSRSRSRRMKGGVDCPKGKAPCAFCKQTGKTSYIRGVQCKLCDGTGKPKYLPVVNGKVVPQDNCSKCGGKGIVDQTFTNTCTVCGGTGCRTI